MILALPLEEVLSHPDTVHLADYECVIHDTENEYREHQIHFYGRPKEVGTYFLGPICGYIASGKPHPMGPTCGRCTGKTCIIGLYDVAPWGRHQNIQHTSCINAHYAAIIDKLALKMQTIGRERNSHFVVLCASLLIHFSKMDGSA